MCRSKPRFKSFGTLIAAAALMAILVGCSQSATESFRVKSKEPTAATPTSPPPAPPAASTPTAPAEGQQRRPVAMPPGIARPEDVTSDFTSPAPVQNQGGMDPPSGAGQQTPPVAAGEYVRADVGVGQKGRTLERGFITTPVQVYFRSQEHMAFRIQVPQALQLFQAEHGRRPESHEEFWREIIEKNGIRLPTLPPGHKYVYVPEAGELMVEVPAGSPPP